MSAETDVEQTDSLLPDVIATAPAFSHGHDSEGFPFPCRCPDEENLDGPEA